MIFLNICFETFVTQLFKSKKIRLMRIAYLSINYLLCVNSDQRSSNEEESNNFVDKIKEKKNN